jgi:hypothetical protein
MRSAKLLLAAVVASGVTAVVAEGAQSARLAFASSSTVKGTHFAPRERVRVRFGSGSTVRVVVVRANQFGTFVITVPSAIPDDQCGPAIVVSAAGVQGGAALVRRPPRMCAPATPAGPVSPVPAPAYSP